MKRTILKENNLKELLTNDVNYFAIDSSLKEVDIPSNSSINLLITKPHQELTINVKENASLFLSLLVKENIDGGKLNINVSENAKVEVYFADFSFGKETFIFNGQLLGRDSSLNWHLASLTADNDQKQFDISVKHLANSTFAKMDNYGVCKDDGKLVFSGISHVINGASSSKTHQNAKIMVFDEKSIGIAKPILKIDENDVEASHAAVVGKINDEHLFYLTSRGLSESAAKELITLGYLKPILNGFMEEEIKEEIMSLIERRM